MLVLLMNHLDLFSGIGGFALAAKRVWGPAYKNIGFCEINKYCQAVLRKNFGKDVTIYEDIKTLTNANGIGLRGVKEQKLQKKKELPTSFGNDTHRCDVLTGGFPCQPFSVAGSRNGRKDERYLWHEMFRVIQEFRPRWIIGENVGGILSMAEFSDSSEVGTETDLFGNRVDTHSRRGRGILFGILEELGEIGYSVQTFLIPALAVGCCHRRDRVWIVASDSKLHGLNGSQVRKSRPQRGNCDKTGKEEILQSPRSDLSRTDASDTFCKGLEGRHEERQGYCGQFGGIWSGQRANWNKNWFEVASQLCRVDDGVSVELDGFKCSKSVHRVERLKALGNSIVPEVAERIMWFIKEIDDENSK